MKEDTFITSVTVVTFILALILFTVVLPHRVEQLNEYYRINEKQ